MIRCNEENVLFPLLKLFFIWLQRRRIYFSFCKNKKHLKKKEKRFFAYFAISSSCNIACVLAANADQLGALKTHQAEDSTQAFV